jgi:SAM-dependent methyltransferase
MDEIEKFYDELAAFYDLIYADWPRSGRRHGEAISRLIEQKLPGKAPHDLTVLDVSAGIGTQSLPLAERGYRVRSRDLSAHAIERLIDEARSRGLSIEARPADMRDVDSTISEPNDVVLSFDNAIAHLLSDRDLSLAFSAFHRALRPGGLCVISVRDYDQVERGTDSVQTYGVRFRDGVRCLPLQAWHWIDDTRYEGTFFLVFDGAEPQVVRTTTAPLYAVSTARLLELLREAGFVECERLDDVTWQPVLVARKPGA